MHVELRTHTGFDACVGARDAGVGRTSASLLFFLDRELWVVA